MNFDTWIRQPSTLHGLGIIAGGIGAALSHVTTGNTTIDAVVAVSAYALVHLGINDNSTMQQGITTLTTDLIQGASTAKLMGDAAPVITGASALLAPTATISSTSPPAA